MAGDPRRWARGRLAGVIVYVLWAAYAPTPSRGDDWPTYQHDAQHRGGSSSSLDPRDLIYSWSAPPGFDRGMIVGSTVFSTWYAGEAAAFDLDTGELKWNHTADLGLTSPPSYAEGWLVYASETSKGDQLIVHDAKTGAVMYRVDMTIRFGSRMMPTLDRNPQTGALVAYLANGSQVEAIELGASGGASLWTGTGRFGGSSLPTLCGGSLILAGSRQYYAFDIYSGASNHFQDGNNSGGGGNTAVCDESRSQFYIMESFETSQTVLSAWELIDNDNISLLWQQLGQGVLATRGLALDSEGNIYSAGAFTLVVRSPETGDIMDMNHVALFSGKAPILTDKYIWTLTNTNIRVYDRMSLERVAGLPGPGKSVRWNSVGAVSDNHFILYDGGGFDVFTTPCQFDNDCNDANACTDDFCDPADPDADEFGCAHEDIGCVSGRVTLCHTAPGSPGNSRTVTVGCAARPAHLAHGDTCGSCEDGSGSRSAIPLRSRGRDSLTAKPESPR